jgi:hypothetical protein
LREGPRGALVVIAVAQQETGALLADLAQTPHRRQSRTNQVTNRLVRLIWDPDRGQFVGTVQLGKLDRTPTVSLDPLSRFSRDQ